MTINECTVTKSTCDACGIARYSENGDNPPGFRFDGVYVDPSGHRQPVSFVACKRTHIGKAANNALDALATAQFDAAFAADAARTTGSTSSTSGAGDPDGDRDGSPAETKA